MGEKRLAHPIHSNKKGQKRRILETFGGRGQEKHQHSSRLV